jgi:hypothetical protein
MALSLDNGEQRKSCSSFQEDKERFRKSDQDTYCRNEHPKDKAYMDFRHC